MKTYSFVDLFAGCGGLSLGLSLAGMRGRFAVERDPMAFETFAHNFLRLESPIRCFKWPAWLPKQAWDIDHLIARHKSDIRSLRGLVDVLAGGPPCQGFSFAGRRVADDPRNQLFKRYVELVAELRPKALIVENVPGMRVAHGAQNVIGLRTQTKPAGPACSFYDKLAASLSDLGYSVDSMLLDASRFGVPQKRSRLIVVGVRSDVAARLEGGARRVFEHVELAREAQLRELGLPQRVSAREAISDLESGGRQLLVCGDPTSPAGFLEVSYNGPRTRFQTLMHKGHVGRMDSLRLARHRDDVRERFGRIIAECRKGVRMDDESRRAYGLKKHRIYPMAASDPAPTITTLPDDILHYSEPRILTVRECARLQSFPDWFEFRGKYTTGGMRRTSECPRYTQVGNAVPPYLARAIGVAVRQSLDEAATASLSGRRPASLAALA
jgi:DNA (cytosine-5)-methyltransferase 1